MIDLLPDLERVMEPVLWPEAFDSQGYVYQVKWDGVRILASIKDGEVTLVNKHMRDRSMQYGELQSLSEHVDAQNAILDGEVVVLKEGKPHFPSIMRRDRCSKPLSADYLEALLPVNYMVFDLLYLNGKDLRDTTLEYRKTQLSRIIGDQPYLYLAEDFYDGKSLFTVIQDMGLEGMVAKKKGSFYCQGKNHNTWLKIKCNRTRLCILGGYTLRGQKVNSLLLGGLRDGELIYIGKASSGLSADQLDILSRQLPELRIKDSPFSNLPSTQKGCCFIKPQLGVNVQFLEWTDDIKLRFPVIKDFADISPQECSI